MARPRRVERAVAAYLSARAAAGLSARSVACYRSWLFDFVRESGVRALPKVTTEVVETYLGGLPGRGYAPVSCAAAVSALRCWLRWLQVEGWLPEGPLPSLGRRVTTVPRSVLTVAEVESVLDAVPLGGQVGVRDRAMLEVLYSSALRLRELTSLKLHDVEAGRGVLIVRSGKGDQDRVVPVTERALLWIERYVREQRPQHTRRRDPGTLFVSRQGGVLNAESVRRRVRVALQRAGIAKHATPHCWRHTAATILLEHGMSVRHVQALLGHTAIETTTRYTRVTIEHLKEVHSATHPLETSLSGK